MSTGTSFDVIVVGGGIVGASAAYHLARDGASVLVVDNESPGRATLAGAGIVLPALAPEPPRALDDLLLAASIEYPTLLDELERDGPAGRHAVGAVTVTGDDSDVRKLRETCDYLAARRALGFGFVGDVALLDGAETAARMPLLGSERRSVWVGGAMWIDGPAMAAALLRTVASRDRCRVRRGTVEVVDGGAAIDGERHTGIVVCAAGAWAAGLLERNGLRSCVRTERGQALHLTVEAPDRDLPVVLADGLGYVVTSASGHVVIGATHEPDAGFDARPTVAGLTELVHIATSVLPGIESAAFGTVSVGLRPASPDGLPTVGAVPGQRGLYVATGIGSYGLMAGPSLGALVADLVVDRAPRTDPEPFDPARWL